MGKNRDSAYLTLFPNRRLATRLRMCPGRTNENRALSLFNLSRINLN